VEQGKPEHIAEKIVIGKMEKYFEQEVLAEQPFAKDPSMTVGEYLRSAGGDDAAVVRFVRYKLGED
jgi:elongation factor Ts